MNRSQLSENAIQHAVEMEYLSDDECNKTSNRLPSEMSEIEIDDADSDPIFEHIKFHK